MQNKKLQNLKPQVNEAVEQLFHHSHMTPANYKAVKEYIAELENDVSSLKFALKHTNDVEGVTAMLEEAETELNWFNDNVRIYRDTRISLLEMHFKVAHAFDTQTSGYGGNPYFDFKDLVEMINCYYGIDQPDKAPNRIAYGWNFCIDKGNKQDGFKGSKLYLWGCIKNYLKRHGIEFTKATSLQIRKVVGLVDVYGDEDVDY